MLIKNLQHGIEADKLHNILSGNVETTKVMPSRPILGHHREIVRKQINLYTILQKTHPCHHQRIDHAYIQPTIHKIPDVLSKHNCPVVKQST